MRLRTKGDLLGGAPVWLCFCLGAYWAWASCAFFGTMAVPFADDPNASSEVVHIVALAVCVLCTLLLPVVVSRPSGPAPSPEARPSVLRFPIVGRGGLPAMTLACLLSAAGTVACVFASALGGIALVPAAAVIGLGEALTLYLLCAELKPGLGDKAVLSVFSLALVVCGVLYLALYLLGGAIALLGMAALPLAILACYAWATSRSRPDGKPDSGSGAPSRSAVASPASSASSAPSTPASFEGAAADSRRPNPWKVFLGFSVFGVAFGLMRSLSPESAELFSSYYLVHELSRLATAACVLAVALFAKNRYWTVSISGIALFALSFLLCYGIGTEPGAAGFPNGAFGTLLLVNAFASAGYTCFELLVWAIIYEIVSETGISFVLTYGLGRGSMQVGIAVGTCVVLALSRLGISQAYVPLFQTSVVVMLVLMLGRFSYRDMSELWGIQKTALAVSRSDEDRVVETLVGAYGLTPRECDVVLLLMKGRSEPYIAETLSVSRSTVHSHIVKTYLKVGVHSRQELLSCVEKRIHSSGGAA